MLAAPKPISSRLASTASWFFRPKLRAVTMPLLKLTSRMPSVASAKSSSAKSLRDGKGKGREGLRNGPHQMYAQTPEIEGQGQ